MKIAWFTPFTKKSAIGKYSYNIIHELINYCEVDLFLFETENLLPTSINQKFLNSSHNLSDELSNYDLIVYNLGDCLPFHQPIYEVFLQHKGIIILHDYVMHHFFAGYYLMERKDINNYIKIMQLLYGSEGEEIALKSVNFEATPIWDTDEVVKYPFFENAVWGALGVITHSQFSAKLVKEKFGGPVANIHLPYTVEDNISQNTVISRSELGIPENKILILSVGHVNPNKRFAQTIKVLGENKNLFQNYVYIIIGSCENQPYYQTLQKIVQDYNLEEQVIFLGFQLESQLKSYISHSDIMINLRNPAMESASWSLAEQMYFGKPIIVSDTGCYSEIPDDCVVKISLHNEEYELKLALNNLFVDENLRKNIGSKARIFALKNFLVKNYCQQFLEFATTVRECKPQLELIDKISEIFSSMEITKNLPILDKVSKEINDFFLG